MIHRQSGLSARSHSKTGLLASWTWLHVSRYLYDVVFLSDSGQSAVSFPDTTGHNGMLMSDKSKILSHMVITGLSCNELRAEWILDDVLDDNVLISSISNTKEVRIKAEI